MTTKTKKFSHKGKTYEVMVTPGRDGFSVRAFDQSGHGVGRRFSVTYETEGDFRRVTGDPAVAVLMQLAQEDIEKKHLKEPKKANVRIVGHLGEFAFCVSYTSFGDQELELPDRFDHIDEAIEAAWVLLNAGIARMVDIPDPKRKGGAAASATPRLSIEASEAVMSYKSATMSVHENLPSLIDRPGASLRSSAAPTRRSRHHHHHRRSRRLPELHRRPEPEYH